MSFLTDKPSDPYPEHEVMAARILLMHTVENSQFWKQIKAKYGISQSNTVTDSRQDDTENTWIPRRIPPSWSLPVTLATKPGTGVQIGVVASVNVGVSGFSEWEHKKQNRLQFEVMGKRKGLKKQVQQVNTSAVITNESDHCTQKKKGKTVKPPTFTISGCFEPYPLKELISARTVLIKTIQGNHGNIWGPLKERLGIFPDGRRRLSTDQSVNWLPQPVPFEKWCCPIVVQSFYRGSGTSIQTSRAFDVRSEKLTSSVSTGKVFPGHNISDKGTTHRVLCKRKMSLNLIGNGGGIPDKSTLHAGSDFDLQISKKKKNNSGSDQHALCEVNYSKTLPNPAETASAGNHTITALAIDKQSSRRKLVASLKKKSRRARLKKYKERQQHENKTKSIKIKSKKSLNLIGNGRGIPDKSTLHVGSDFDPQISKKNYSRTLPNPAETASAANHSETALAIDKQSPRRKLVAPLKKVSACARLKRYKQRQLRIKKRQERENRTKSTKN